MLDFPGRIVNDVFWGLCAVQCSVRKDVELFDFLAQFLKGCR